MERENYYIYEIMGNGNLKKASLRNFKTKEEAEKSIIHTMHPIDQKRLVAIKTRARN